MGHYHVLMFITREQETAIKNLFSQHGWVFCCKVMPPALCDSVILQSVNLLTGVKTGSSIQSTKYHKNGSVDSNYRRCDLNMNAVIETEPANTEMPAVSESFSDDLQGCTQVSSSKNCHKTISTEKSNTVYGGLFDHYKDLTHKGTEELTTSKNTEHDTLKFNPDLKNIRSYKTGSVQKPVHVGNLHKRKRCLKEDTCTSLHKRQNLILSNSDISNSTSGSNVKKKHRTLHQKDFDSSNEYTCISKASKHDMPEFHVNNRNKHKKKQLASRKEHGYKSDDVQTDYEDQNHLDNRITDVQPQIDVHEQVTSNSNSSLSSSAEVIAFSKAADQVKTDGKPCSIKLGDKSCEKDNGTADQNNKSSFKVIQREILETDIPCESDKKLLRREKSIRLNQEKHQRVCSKCGKRLIRKKICYDCDLTCKYCGKSYANYKTRGRRCLLKTHMKSHEGDKPHVCDICGKAFTHVDYMKRHMKLVHVDTEKITFICKVCSKPFKNTHTLQIHIRSIHNSDNQTYQCDTCGSIFRRKGTLMAHLRRVHVKTKDYKCDECDLMVKTADSLRSHKRTAHSPRVRTVCYICGAMLLSEDKLKKHLMRHKNSRTYQCTKCDKKFYTSHEVRQHFRTHTGEKPFKCHLCTYACAVKGNLTKHMKTHRSGNFVPGHNYIGSDYSLDYQDATKEFVKLDENKIEDVEQGYSSEIFGKIYIDQNEEKVYQQL